MKLTSILLLGGLAAGVLTASEVTYTYTGNDFDPNQVVAPYTSADFVSGFFTVASPLGASLTYGPFTPDSYSFTDQHQTFDSATPPPNVTFDVGTDASGNINKWEIVLQNGLNQVSTFSFASDSGEMGASGGNILFDPGTWVESTAGTSPVPEPGNVALIGLGLVGIGLVRRKLQQRRSNS